MDNIISDRISELVKRDNCFDFIRYFFAFSLILVHFCTLTETEQFWFITGGTRVKAFFVITGFLVTYSLLRRKELKNYFEKRVRRIVPAYVVVIVVCFVWGMIISTCSLTEFLTSGQTYKYLIANLAFMNFVEPSLPGVFEGHYEEAMDGSLWSMKI